MNQLCLKILCGLGVLYCASLHAAQPIALNARTAGELATLCAADPASPGGEAKVNFCHGFAQGAVEDRMKMATDKKPVCFPTPTPSRAATMKDFVGWVRAAPAHLDLPVLDGLFRFLGERYPCK